MTSTQDIKCNCYTKCYCMEMSCESCGISGMLFNPYIVTPSGTSSIPVCSCKTKTEQYCKSDICRCKHKCLCFLK